MSGHPLDVATKAARDAERRFALAAILIADEAIAGRPIAPRLIEDYKQADAANKAAHAHLYDVLGKGDAR